MRYRAVGRDLHHGRYRAAPATSNLRSAARGRALGAGRRKRAHAAADPRALRALPAGDTRATGGRGNCRGRFVASTCSGSERELSGQPCACDGQLLPCAPCRSDSRACAGARGRSHRSRCRRGHQLLIVARAICRRSGCARAAAPTPERTRRNCCRRGPSRPGVPNGRRDVGAVRRDLGSRSDAGRATLAYSDAQGCGGGAS